MNYNWERLINPSKKKIANPWGSKDYWQFRNKEELRTAIKERSVIGYKNGDILVIRGQVQLLIKTKDKSVTGSLNNYKKENFLKKRAAKISFLIKKGINPQKAEDVWESNINWINEEEVIELAVKLKNKDMSKFDLEVSDLNFKKQFQKTYNLTPASSNSKTLSAMRISNIL